MKTDPEDGGVIWTTWTNGGVLAGPALASHGVVTVEPGYQLNVFNVPGYNKNSVRWFQRSDNSQVEIVVPNVRSIELDKSLDADVDAATIVIDNTWLGNPIAQGATDLGAPGYFSPERGLEGTNRWGHAPGPWTGILGRNALLRTYQGYGGHGKTLVQAVADGNLVKTGTWLVDDPQVTTDGHLTLKCRSMAKLLVDQEVYPPLVPAALYPIQFSRFWYREVYNPIILYGTSYTGVPQKDVTGMALTSSGDGYWIVGNDGGIFSYGNSVFHGSDGAVPVWFTNPTSPHFAARMVGIARCPDSVVLPPDVLVNPGEGDEVLPASGYHLALNTGAVFSYGAAVYHGGESFPARDCIGIMNAGNLDGYWLVRSNGSIYSFGAASYHGGTPSLPPGQKIVGFASTPSGHGYWLCDGRGQVFSFGDAGYHGGVTATLAAPVCGMTATPSGHGYYLVATDGGVFTFGDAIYRGSIGTVTRPWTFFDWQLSAGNTLITGSFGDFVPADVGRLVSDFNNTNIAGGTHIASYVDSNHVHMSVGALHTANPVVGSINRPITLADPVCGIAVMPDNSGYWLVAKDGGIFTFNVPFHGSLPGQFTEEEQYTGNYLDLTDIIKDFALWSGFNLYDGVNASVFGAMEQTGIYSTDILDATIFDKKPVIDGLKKIRDIVGYLLWVDDDGALHFENPNFWQSGNVLPDGGRVATVPAIDEKVQLTSYQLSQPDTGLLSALTVGSEDPELNIPGTVFSTVTPPGAADLKGMVKPALYVNQIYVNQADVDTMAALIALHLDFKAHLGAIKCLANPMIELDDQVQVIERQSAEVGVHWVRGIKSTHDLKTGVYEMDLTTSYLSPVVGDWLVSRPAGSVDGAVVIFR